MDESLLLLSVVRYVDKDDLRFMKLLCDIKWPLYDEDESGDIACFALSLCDTADQFIAGLQPMIDAGLDVNHETTAGKCLIEYLAEFTIDSDRVEYLQKNGLEVPDKSKLESLLEENDGVDSSERSKILALI